MVDNARLHPAAPAGGVDQGAHVAHTAALEGLRPGQRHGRHAAAAAAEDGVGLVGLDHVGALRGGRGGGVHRPDGGVEVEELADEGVEEGHPDDGRRRGVLVADQVPAQDVATAAMAGRRRSSSSSGGCVVATPAAVSHAGRLIDFAPFAEERRGWLPKISPTPLLG